MAVAAGVLFQIPLVVLLGGVKILQRFQLHGEPGHRRRFQRGNLEDGALIRPVRPVDPGLVLAAEVRPLPVGRLRVDDGEKSKSQMLQGGLFRVV